MTDYEKEIRKAMIEKGLSIGDLADLIEHRYKRNLSTSIKNKNVTDAFAVPMYHALGLDAGDMYKLKIQYEND
tara:strand:- start:293 stop:511 length:219 start_codon:yes stop_codon:yes gene_type:complete